MVWTAGLPFDFWKLCFKLLVLLMFPSLLLHLCVSVYCLTSILTTALIICLSGLDVQVQSLTVFISTSIVCVSFFASSLPPLFYFSFFTDFSLISYTFLCSTRDLKTLIRLQLLSSLLVSFVINGSKMKKYFNSDSEQ